MTATGGLLVAPPVQAAFVERLASRGRVHAFARGNALDGALLLARRLAEGAVVSPDPAFGHVVG